MLIFILFAVTYGMNHEQMVERIQRGARDQLFDNLPVSLPACNLRTLQSLVDLAVERGDQQKLEILQHAVLQRQAKKEIARLHRVKKTEEIETNNADSAIPQPENKQAKITRLGRVRQTVCTIKQSAVVGLKLLGPILVALILDLSADVSLFKMSGAAGAFGFYPIVAVIIWWMAVANVFVKVIYGMYRWSLAMFKMYAGMLLVVSLVPAKSRSPGFVNQGYSKFLLLYAVFMLLISPVEIFYYIFSWVIFDAFFKRKSLQFTSFAARRGSSIFYLTLAPGFRLKRDLDASPESKNCFSKTITVAAFIFFPLIIFAFGAIIFSWCANKVVQILVDKMVDTAIKKFLLASFPQYQAVDFLFKFIAKVFRSLKLV